MKERRYKQYGGKITAFVMVLCLCISGFMMTPAIEAKAGYGGSYTYYAHSWSDINRANASTFNSKNITIDLEGNITQTKSLNAAWHNITIDLKGHTLYLNRSVYATGHSIVIMDSRGSGAVVITQATSTGCLYARSGGNIQINSGVTLRKGSTSSTVCALGASSSSGLVVNSGATITGFNYGAYLGSGSTMSLYGTISSCTVDGVRGYGTLNMYSGATITNCSGDGVDLSSGTFNMDGGKISGGTLYNRYGVRVSSGSKVYFSGTAEVTGNKGGNVFVPNGYGQNVTISGNVKIGFNSNVSMSQGQKILIANGLVETITSDNSRYIITQENGASYLEAPKPSCNINVVSDHTEMGTVAMNGLNKASATVKYNNTVTLTATVTDSVKYEFKGWQNKSGSIVSRDARYSFSATTDDKYTAMFDRRTYTVTVQLANASTMSSMGRVSASKYSAKYGESVTITATANSGYVFKQWNDGETSASRNITVTGNMTYSAAFSNPPASATATGYIYTNIRKYTTSGTVTGSVGGYVMIPKSLGQTLPQGESVAIAGLPNGSAIGVVGGDVVNSYVSSAYSGKYFSNGNPKLYLTFIQKASSGFDGCDEGGASYFSDLGGWLYWCSGGAAAGAVLFDVYAYQTRTAFKARDIAISRDTEKYNVSNNGGSDTISSSDIIPTVKVGNITYTLTSYSFEDNGINYETGDKTVSLDLGGVLCTYDFPEAVVDGKEYSTLEEAIKAANTSGKPVEVVTPYVSAITEDVPMNGGIEIIQYNGNKIEAGETSKIQADADGTIELSDGTLNVTPKDESETVKVDGGTVTSASQIQVSKKNGEESVITNQNKNAQIIISPDGDPNHTATFNGCDYESQYGIKKGSFTNEQSVEVTAGTDYTVTTTIKDGEENTPVSVQTDVNNTGSTIYTKAGDNLKIDNSGKGDMLTIQRGTSSGEKTDPFTTQSDKTTLTVGPDKSTEEDTSDTQIHLEKGGVTVPLGDSVVLPDGEKITNTGIPQSDGSSEGSEGGEANQPKGDPITVVIPENEDGSKQNPQITIPDGSGADLNGQKVFVPSGNEGINDDVKITLKPEGGLDVEVESGSTVGIGEDEFTAGDYGSDLTVGEDGKTTLKDGDVVLGPGSSITDGNGVTYTYPEDGKRQAVITANDGDKTNVELAEKDSIVYQQDGKEPVEYANPGASEADFDLDPKNGLSAASEVSLEKNSELQLDADGNSIKIKVPEGNDKNVLVDGSANSVTIKEAGDKVQIGNITYKATEKDTALEVGAEHNTLLSGGVKLPKGSDVVFNNTQITSVDEGVLVTADQEDGVPTGKGKVTVPAGKQFALGEDGKQITFQNPESEETTYVIDEAGDLHLPSGEKISFKTGKDMTTVSAQTDSGEGAKINSVDGNVTITTQEKDDTITVNGHTYKSLGITMTGENGSAVEDPVMELSVTQKKEVVLTRGQAQLDAGNELGVYDNDGNLLKIVNNKTDPTKNPVYVNTSGEIKVPNEETELSVAGMKYTTAKDNTILAATPKGVELMEGSVAFEKNNVVVANDMLVKNLGDKKITIEVQDEEAPDQETGKKPMTMKVPAGGSFDFTMAEDPLKNYSFSNPSKEEGEEAEYVLDKDGKLILPQNQAMACIFNGKENVFSSEDAKVTFEVTEEGVTVTVSEGESLTINGKTYKNADPSTPLILAVDKDGNVILKQNTMELPAGGSINIKKDDGSLLKLENPSSAEDAENTPQNPTVSFDGKVTIPVGSSIKAGKTTYTGTGDEKVEIALALGNGDNRLISGTDLDVTNGSIDLGDGKPTISTIGDKPVHISSPASGKPSVEVEPGGNASFTKKPVAGEAPKTVEVSVPESNGEKQAFDFTGEGTIETTVTDGKTVVMGGVTYTASGNGTIAIDDEDGSFEKQASNLKDDELKMTIDSSDFDKENYEMKVAQGTSVIVDGVEYKAQEGAFVMSGNPSGKPIIRLETAGATIRIDDVPYTAESSHTKFYVVGKNSIALLDNGSREQPSALKISGNKAVSVNGVRYTTSKGDATYTVIYGGVDGDKLQVPEDTKLTVNLLAAGKKIQLMGKSTTTEQNAQVVTNATITAESEGTTLVIDHSKKDENGVFTTTQVSGIGRSYLKEVKNSSGIVVGYAIEFVGNTDSSSNHIPPTQSTVTIPVTSDGKVEISGEIINDTVEVETIEKEVLNQMVDDQLKNITAEIENAKIELNVSDTEVESVTLTVTTLENIIDTIQTNEKVQDEFSIKMSGGEITLDSQAMGAIVDQAISGKVEIKIEQITTQEVNSSQNEALTTYEVVKIYQTSVVSNGKQIHDFRKGKVEVGVDFEIPEGTDKFHYHIYYVDSKGGMTRHETKYSDGKLYYVTDHFSEYAIVYDKTMKNETEEEPIETPTETPEQKPEKSVRSKMYLRQTKATTNSITLSWSKIKNADGYRIWMKDCSSGKSAKLLKKITNGKKLSYTALKLKSGKCYRFTIYAYKMVDGKRVVIGESRMAVHAVTLGGKYTNPTKISVNTTKVTLSKGTYKTIKVTVDKKGTKKLTNCVAKVRYYTTNSAVAKVNKNGKITAVSKGSCYIYVIVANGLAKKIKVTVR